MGDVIFDVIFIIFVIVVFLAGWNQSGVGKGDTGEELKDVSSMLNVLKGVSLTPFPDWPKDKEIAKVTLSHIRTDERPKAFIGSAVMYTQWKAANPSDDIFDRGKKVKEKDKSEYGQVLLTNQRLILLIHQGLGLVGKIDFQSIQLEEILNIKAAAAVGTIDVVLRDRIIHISGMVKDIVNLLSGKTTQSLDSNGNISTSVPDAFVRIWRSVAKGNRSSFFDILHS